VFVKQSPRAQEARAEDKSTSPQGIFQAVKTNSAERPVMGMLLSIFYEFAESFIPASLGLWESNQISHCQLSLGPGLWCGSQSLCGSSLTPW
jgi:hypothetical protein